MTNKSSRIKQNTELRQRNVAQRKSRIAQKTKAKHKTKKRVHSAGQAKSYKDLIVKKSCLTDTQYYVFWKPYDVLSQFTSAAGSSADTLASYVKVKDIYPVGRLDRDSEGLLILSDDGLFQHKLCDPRFEHWRTYLVQVERKPDENALEKLRLGVVIKGQLTRPAHVELLEEAPDLPVRHPPIRKRKNIETAWLRLSLSEGMNRQVRRMTAAVGYPTLRLVRESIRLSSKVLITLNDLEPGQLRVFNQSELAAVNVVKNRQAQRTIRRQGKSTTQQKRTYNE